MEPSRRILEEMAKKPSNSRNHDESQDIIEIIYENIQELRNEIRNIQMMLRGIDTEIQEIKNLTQRNRIKIEQYTGKGVVKKSAFPRVREITSGLDLLEIPPHLRRTFQTIMQFNSQGATAREVSTRTGKSRPLESDYLNQLTERGYISKKQKGKRVLFYHKTGNYEETEEELSDGNDTSDSTKYETKKKVQVNKISISSKTNS